jgi:hypothetical protein
LHTLTLKAPSAVLVDVGGTLWPDSWPVDEPARAARMDNVLPGSGGLFPGLPMPVAEGTSERYLPGVSGNGTVASSVASTAGPTGDAMRLGPGITFSWRRALGVPKPRRFPLCG